MRLQFTLDAKRVKPSMDFNFEIDDYGRPVATFSAGHEAIGRWFSDELHAAQDEIAVLLEHIENIEKRTIANYQVQGQEFQLSMDRNAAEVLALALSMEAYGDHDKELPEGTNLYEQESQAECGLLDFKHALLCWQEFVASNS